MYDELIKRLRNRRICIQQSGSFDDFPMLREAADAIEELQKRKHGKWECVTVTDISDRMNLPFASISSMKCNQCNRYHNEVYHYGIPTEMARFCSFCGARMVENDERT